MCRCNGSRLRDSPTAIAPAAGVAAHPVKRYTAHKYTWGKRSMFRFDDKPTQTSTVLRHIIDHSVLTLDPDNDNSHTCTIYRTDPLDQYAFITVHAGVRYTEPLYGGVTYDDERNITGSTLPGTPNPFGFRARERVCWHESFSEIVKVNWRIHLSGRGAWDASRDRIEDFRRITLPVIREVIESTQDRSSPPLPELWYRERLARDDLRNRFRGIRVQTH